MKQLTFHEVQSYLAVAMASINQIDLSKPQLNINNHQI